MIDTGKQIKRQKTVHVEDQVVVPQRNFLSNLPLELLAEILKNTSPRELLALSRCSQHFCDTLVNSPNASFIWKCVRARYEPPIPDPFPGTNEPAWAAFLFDGGTCERCGKHTKKFHKSYAMRLRLCSELCFIIWKGYSAMMSMDNPLWTLIPHSESPWLENDWFYYRRSDAVPVYEYIDNSTALSHMNNIVAENEEIMKHATKLYEWREKREDIEETHQYLNNCVTLQIAEDEGWQPDLLLASPTFSRFLREKNQQLVHYTRRDFKSVRNDVAREVMRIHGKWHRSKQERDYGERRQEILKFYNKLRATRKEEVFPTVSEFCRLPVISMLKNFSEKDSQMIKKELNDTTINRLINDNLKLWQKRVEQEFLEVLGYAKYYAAEEVLLPVYRLTAIFNCSDCAKRYCETPLSLREACAHRCPGLSKKRKASFRWATNKFVKDTKAINVTRKILDILCLREQDELIKSGRLDPKSSSIVCLSCNGFIVMNFKAAQRHAKRHEDMIVGVLDLKKLQPLDLPATPQDLCYGLIGYSKGAERKRLLKIYGCRHCIPSDAFPSLTFLEGPQTKKNIPSSIELADTALNGTGPEVSKKDPRKKSSLMSFDGLRCHLKQCHGVLHISDEDVYYLAS